MKWELASEVISSPISEVSLLGNGPLKEMEEIMVKSVRGTE